MKKIGQPTSYPIDQSFSPVNQGYQSVDWGPPSVDQELSSVDQCSAQEYPKSTSGPIDYTLRGKISKFKLPKASPTTLNGYILGEVYKSPHMLEFWSTEKESKKSTKREHSLKASNSNPFKHPKRKKRKKALSLSKIQRASSSSKRLHSKEDWSAWVIRIKAKSLLQIKAHLRRLLLNGGTSNHFFTIHLNTCICVYFDISTHCGVILCFWVV